MLYILVGTNRENSRSQQVAEIIKPLYEKQGLETKIMNLNDVGIDDLTSKSYAEIKPQRIQDAVEELLNADGLVCVVPEYNGSMPGALKYFIDHWKYPDSFEHRPVAFIGLGGMFGGLRPVEHLQQVFGYRNAFIFPDRIFMHNVWNYLNGGEIKDETIFELLKHQSLGFGRFIKALKSEKLHGKDYKREK